MSEAKSLKCAICGKDVKGEHLTDHIGTHYTTCAHCPQKKFLGHSALINHQKIHKQLKVQCTSSLCMLRFKNKAELAAHKCKGNKGSKK